MHFTPSVPTLVLFSAFLLGCGSTTEETTSVGAATASAKLDTADQVLQAAAFLNAASAFDAAALAFTTIESPQVRKQVFGSTKLSIEDAPCDASGNFDFRDTGGPAGATDFLFFSFERCVDDAGTFFDGRLELICTEGAFRSDDQASCTNTSIHFGEGRRPLEVREFGGEQVRLSGSFFIRVGSIATTVEQSLEARVTSADGSQEGLLVTRELEQRRESSGSGLDEITINGEVGVDFSGEAIRCNRGLVELRTQNQLLRNADGDFVGGELLLVNAEGDEATVSFADDASVSVNIDGVTRSRPQSEFEQACSF